jgi:hypothetical protein
MTREHIVPAWLSERAQTPLVANVRTTEGEIAITGQPTVKDVCRDCNNGPLSSLDEYARQLYESYFQTIVEPRDLITFQYDFHLLSRWLLKIAYNTARARQWRFGPSRALLDYVIGITAPEPGVEAVLQLVIPTKEVPGVHPRIIPFENRVALLMPELLWGLEAGFLVSVSSYHFYLVIPTEGMPPRLREKAFEKLRKSLPGGVRLACKKCVKVYASFVDFLALARKSPGLIRNVQLKRKGN